MNCTGNCSQGDKVCPHPQRCEQFDGVPLREVLLSLLWPVALVGGIAAIVALWRSWPWW
jgi:hypothetical protein